MRTKVTTWPAVMIGLIGCIWMFASVGCKTLQEWASPARFAAIAKLACYSSCVVTAGEPGSDSRTRWIQTLAELRLIVTDKDWSAHRLGAALNKVGISEMLGSEGKLVIAGGIVLHDLFFNVIYPVDTSIYIEAVATGARDGIDLALNYALLDRTSRTAPVGWRENRIMALMESCRVDAEATRKQR